MEQNLACSVILLFPIWCVCLLDACDIDKKKEEVRSHSDTYGTHMERRKIGRQTDRPHRLVVSLLAFAILN